MTDDPTRREPGPTDPLPAYDPGPTQPMPVADQAEPATGFAAAPVPVAAAGANRVRWAIGLGVAGLAIAVAIGAYLLLAGQPTPEALRYVPGDAAMVIEIRPELPGDQLQKLGNLLAHFPGFDDQATLTDKIDEAFSRMVGSAAEGLDYRTDIKPWLNGPAFIVVRPSGSPTSARTMERALVSATTTGTVTCDAPFEGQTVTHESYRGLDLLISADVACVTDGRQALVGDTQSVRDALDAKASGTGMDKSERYGAARRALTGDQLATVYVDGTAFVGLMPLPSFGEAVPGLGGIGGLADLAGRVPEWGIVGLRAEDDALIFDSVAAPLPAPTAGPSLLPDPATHPSALTPMLPPNTIVLVEHQGAGVTIQNLITTLKADPALGSSLAMLDGMGGANELVGWIEAAGFVVLNGPDTPTGGVLLVAPDEATATGRLATFNGLIALLGLSGGGVEVRESTINGVAVTTVVITDVGSIIPPGTLPDGVEPPASGPIEFSIAAKGRVIVLGVGEGFMTAVLSVQPGASLADQAVYRKAVERALANSRTSVYVAVRDLVGLVEGFLPEEAKGPWEADVRPYVAPIIAVSVSTSNDAGAMRSRLAITVSEP